MVWAVYKNGAATGVSCQLAVPSGGTGYCTSASTVAVAAGDRISYVEVSDTNSNPTKP